MAEVKVQVDPEKPEHERRPMLETTRKVLLAGMGAVALTQEEVEKIVKKLVERGELAQKDAQKLLKEVLEKRKKEAKRAEGELDRRIDEILGRMNVPTKSDIETLSVKITALAKKVDELKKAQSD